MTAVCAWARAAGRQEAGLTTPLNGAATDAIGSDARHAAQGSIAAIYSLTIFGSALLLFAVQPMISKALLPLLGGASAVWNTALVFFQALLLAGYIYAFALSRLKNLRHQVFIHLAVIVVFFLTLPIGIPDGWVPPATDNPIPWLVAALFVSVGAPFFALATSAPLFQNWFAHTSHKDAANPYFLYAASNLGGFVALLTYPTLVEPGLTLVQQRWAWSIGFIIFAAMVAACGFYLPRGRHLPTVRNTDPSANPATETGKFTRPTTGRRLRWILLAFAPSSLLLGNTNFMTTDIAAVPLLWVVPLALYLLTFVVAFGRRPLLPHNFVLIAQPLFILPLVLWFYWIFEPSLSTLFGIHLLAFFMTALMCHGELARTRPHTDYLTEFYLWISVGGVLGGAFNGLLAPLIFDDIVEYRLVFVMACLLVPARPLLRQMARLPWITAGIGLAGVVVIGALLYTMGEQETELTSTTGIAATAAIILLVLALSRRPVWYGTAISVILIAGVVYEGTEEETIFQGRTYFGVYKVVKTGLFHQLYHGTTIHGVQHRDPEVQMEPISYYSKEGPIGQMFDNLALTPERRRVAIIGLGSGVIACYGRPGEKWTFFEIDPLVERVALNNEYFTYMQKCPPTKDTVIGDARLTLQKSPEREFDMIFLDAFTSDAIPTHLLTREAIKLYLSKLRDGGVIVFNISNRHISLRPVLREVADELGLAALAAADDETPYYHEVGMIFESEWVVLARKLGDFGKSADGPMWEVPEKIPGTRVWTDDYSNLFKAITWIDE